MGRGEGGQRVLSRVGAVGLVAGLAVVGPLLESALGGGGRGWVVGMLLMVLAPSLVKAGGARFHPLDPETFVPATYFLSAGYAPTLHLVLSRSFALSAAETSGFQVAYLGAVGCALVCTALSKPRAAPEERSPLAPELLPRDWAVIAAGGLGMLLVAVWVAQTGIDRLLSASYVETYQHEQGKGLLTAGWFVVQLAIVHCAARVADIRAAGMKVPWVLYTALAVMVVLFLFNTALGRRGPLLWLIASVALCLHLSRVRVPRWWLAVGVGLIPIYAYAIEGYRSQLGEGAEAQLASVQAGLSRLDNPFVIPELETVFGTLVIMVEQEPPILMYPGESWVNAVLIQVPRPLWEDRPTSLSARYVWWMSPSFAREGGGLAFNMTAEGYLNLGYFGALLQIAVVTAVFFFGPLAAHVGRMRDPLERALAACLGSVAYNQFRGELASLFKVSVAFLISAALVHVASALLQHLRDRARREAPRGWRARPGSTSGVRSAGGTR
ncbi:Hypothetical protein CAP_5721 [Chondromyces apiculatus DSM 436]|uniref:Oligosaccharide repeat unit polymerase n=1 Tax=Chondromyces apiculatus DSM 436 TaxID=1192034 RepID=A0A017T2J7_9BACT|nr:Hypothetical protein CAP_5721 [Chondromyces apiculatus DSM 436]